MSYDTLENDDAVGLDLEEAEGSGSKTGGDTTMTLKFSAGTWLFTSGADRFCPEGYREAPKFSEILSAVSRIRSVRALDILHTDITPDVPVKDIKRMLKESGITCSCVTVNLAQGRRFMLGGLTHQHPKLRNAAIDECRKAVDLARALGTGEVALRLYTDGFDYPFQADYAAHWNTLISSIKTIAKYATPDVNVAIIYKPREPRRHLAVSSVGKVLSMCQEIAMKNVGVGINLSHAMLAGENPAESIAFLSRASKLFQVYFSDTEYLMDDQMIPGSIHMWETMEALFYLRAARYKGYVTLDLYPQRMEPLHALQIAMGNISILWKKLEKLDIAELRKAQKALDIVETQRIIRRAMLQG